MTNQKPKFKSNLISFCAIIFGLLASFGGIDITSLAVLIALGGLFLLIQKKQLNQFLKANSSLLFFLILIVIFVLYFVSNHLATGQKINDTIKYLLANLILFPLLIYSLKPEYNDKKIARAIFAGFCIGLALLIFEAIDNYAMYKLANPNQAIKAMEVNLGRGAYIIIAAYWPAMLAANALKIDMRIKIMLFVLTIFLGTRFGIDLNVIIFILANIGAFIALYYPKLIIGLVFTIGGTLIAGAPVIYGHIANLAKNLLGSNLPMSYERRADMWLYALSKIKEKPIWGYGLDSSRQFQDKVYLGGYEWTAIQMHPHSAPLHIWLEGGVVGAILLLAILFYAAFISLQSKNLNKENSWAFCGLLISILAVWALSHSIWEQWLWAISAILFCFIFAIKIKKSEKTNDMIEI